jgi:alanine racemase
MEMLPVWAEIDLDAIGRNVREARRIADPGALVMAVVKADAYGHGAIRIARTVLADGADYLGVARAAEGIELRQAGIRAPILIFAPSSPQYTDQLISYDLTQTVCSLSMAEAYSDFAVRLGRSLKIQLKVDTGMGRLGLVAFPGPSDQGLVPGKDFFHKAKAIDALPGLHTEGTYTHFASADSPDKTSARQQMKLFVSCIHELHRHGIRTGLCHAANSAALIDMPQTHLDMVRPGIMLYGLDPSREMEKSRVSLKPAMQLKTRVTHIKHVPAGFSISYGATWRTRSPTRIATVAIGYADGYCGSFPPVASCPITQKTAPFVTLSPLPN